jgi:4a-hydroxytetrahydrobiopterin dehydratase
MTERLTRGEISAAVQELGWRYILGELRAAVAAGSLARGAELASQAVAACGADADGHLRVDLRPDAVVFALHTPEQDHVTPLDIELAGKISAVADTLGLTTAPDSVQLLEVAIDALDVPAVRPFWKAVLGYVDVPGRHGDSDPLVDPLRQGPAVWFQQMDAPRPQRNRIHFDISVAHDAAPARLEAALAAGGVLVSDRRAPAFWVLADAEGNEACITTWQGRD